jgi:hypothetical protein
VLYIYLFASVAGGLLVLVSLFSGGHHDAGTDAGGGGADSAHLVGHGDGVATGADGQPGHGAEVAAPAGLGAALGWLLSVQLWTYLLAFGGLTGFLLRTLAHVPEPLAGGGALAVGLGTALAARAVLRRVIGSTDSGTTSYERLVGSSAQVLIPAGPGSTGKIRLTARGQTLDLLARASDGGELVADGVVSILDVRDGVAEVSCEDAPVVPTLAAPATAAEAQRLAVSSSGAFARAPLPKKDPSSTKG